MGTPTTASRPAGHLALTPPDRRALNRLATAAQRGDRGARDQLHALLTPTIVAFGRRSWPIGSALEPDEVTNVAFLVLVEVIADWPGADFGSYFLCVFPRRLRRALGQVIVGPPAAPAAIEVPDPDPAARLARELIELAADLTPAQRWLLGERVVADRSLAEIARQSGLPLRTLKRRWREVVALLRLAWTR